MSKKLRIRSAIFAAVVAAWGFSGAAFALDETEPNDSVTAAQSLVIGEDGTATVSGVLGVASGDPILDVDFYSFEGKAGDVVTVDIDGGMITSSTGLDSAIALFGPNGSNPVFLWNQVDNPSSNDTGSVSRLDARIDSFKLQETGTYYIGITDAMKQFLDASTLSSTRLTKNSNGAYTLIISGVTPTVVTPAVMPINIIIKPDTTEVARINPKSMGRIPVALLSSAEFDAMDVDPGTLTFGAEGDEASFERCNRHGRDYNGDGLLDLVCNFDTKVSGFEEGDTEGVLRGTTKSGVQFEGRGWLKVVNPKRHLPDYARYYGHHHHRHGHDHRHGDDHRHGHDHDHDHDYDRDHARR